MDKVAQEKAVKEDIAGAIFNKIAEAAYEERMKELGNDMNKEAGIKERAISIASEITGGLGGRALGRKFTKDVSPEVSKFVTGLLGSYGTDIGAAPRRMYRKAGKLPGGVVRRNERVLNAVGGGINPFIGRPIGQEIGYSLDEAGELIRRKRLASQTAAQAEKASNSPLAKIKSLFSQG